jgi:hypothetical protein
VLKVMLVQGKDIEAPFSIPFIWGLSLEMG